MMVRLFSATLILLGFTVGPLSASEADQQGIEFFEKRIRPVLVRHCYKCHSRQAAEVQAGLLLDTRVGIRQGGDSGAVVVPGHAAASRLILALRYRGPEMPPDGKLPKAVIADFEHWVKIGVPDSRNKPDPLQAGTIDIEAGRRFWAFQPLGDFHPPAVAAPEWVRTPIDRFVLAKLEKKGLKPAGVADRYQLIRRAYFDLIGLPPPPAAVRAFVADRSPKAYEELIERLLESPHYGERWARHWLDVARFAESNGFEKDEDRPTAYHYRDFVIRALNQDMPYDTFVKWQIAGDVLRPDDNQARLATGFLVAGVENIIQTQKEFERDRYDKLDDIVTTLGTAMLGLTVGCARCHDHKYDPITQRDYYRLVSSFGRTVSSEVELTAPSGHIKAFLATEVTGEIHNKNQGFAIPAGVSFLVRGDVNSKRGVALPSFPQVLMRGGKTETHWQDQGSSSKTAASPRIALAHWITDGQHGAGNLLARVMVNRLWQHHFGTGLVATPSNFGQRGMRPTHPELLDWLAGEFMRPREPNPQSAIHKPQSSGWSIKAMHRLIMSSSVYRQAYQEHAGNSQIDPENRLLWRRSVRRLEAEAIRDAMLEVSGILEKTLYGRGKLDEQSRQRSIYLTVKRSKLIPMLQLFDAPDALQGVGRRQTTTIAPQSLLLMNNKRVRGYANDFARRIDPDGTRAIDQVIRDGFLIALSRPPSDDERRSIRELIRQQIGSRRSGDNQARTAAVTDFCQLLMCLNEFVYL